MNLNLNLVLSILWWLLLYLVHWALRGHEVLDDGLMLLCWYRGKLLEWQLLSLLSGEVHITQGGGKGFGHELIPERDGVIWHIRCVSCLVETAAESVHSCFSCLNSCANCKEIKR
jgi:hypothetical protein